MIEATIEIQKGTQNKYEVDKRKHRIKLNRVLNSKMTYPAEYGFIEKTLAVDADPQFEDIRDINDIKALLLKEIKLFFQTNKELQPGHHVEVFDYYPREDALCLIERCQKAYTLK